MIKRENLYLGAIYQDNKLLKVTSYLDHGTDTVITLDNMYEYDIERGFNNTGLYIKEMYSLASLLETLGYPNFIELSCIKKIGSDIDSILENENNKKVLLKNIEDLSCQNIPFYFSFQLKK